LRDFYSLIKVVGSKPTIAREDVANGVMRNFGGTLINTRDGKTEASASRFLTMLDDIVNPVYAAPQHRIL
jgi:hypothetical protein